MHRLLRELDRLDAGRITGRPRRPGDGRRRGTTVAVGVVVVGAVVLSVAHDTLGISVTAQGLHHRHRLLPEAHAGTAAGSFDFKLTQTVRPGQPVTYDPCRPVELEVNEDLAPAGADTLLHQALARMSAASGLELTVVGHTHRLPGETPTTGDRRPGLVAWTTPEQLPGLRGRVVGLGGSTAVTDGMTGLRQYVTGTVSLDAPTLSAELHRPGGPAEVRAVMMHELGHLLGLGHVHDPGELMDADNVGRVTLGPGDRRGLAAVGSGHCFP